MGNRKEVAERREQNKRRLVTLVVTVMAFLSGAACAFYYAYQQPFCKINLYPNIPQALPL